MDVFSTIPPSLIMPNKTLYRIKNWKKYNEALIRRGSVTFWIAEDALTGWIHRGPRTRGRPCVFSDTAIECALTVRAVFRLPLRQTEGFLRSVFTLMGTDLPVPDYSTLSLRAVTLRVDLRQQNKAPLHLILDSTGLKIRGEGEWRRKTHGKSGHRKWRKLHIGINAVTQEIEAVALTASRVHDATPVPRLLRQVSRSITSVTADGSFDQIGVYHACWKRDAVPVIPPRKDAKIRRYRKDPADGKWKRHVACMDRRDAAVRAIRRGGRKRWKQESAYHRRSLVETAMFRQKHFFGQGLRHKKIVRQRTEVLIRCRALNLMTRLGMPESVRVT